MSEYFENMDPLLAERLGRLYEELRALKDQKALLHSSFGVESAEELLERIRKGEMDEHPSYEVYLALLTIEDEIERLRERIKREMEEA